MAKKRTEEPVNIGELLPKFEDLSDVVDKKLQDKADKASHKLLVLIGALDESVVRHAKRLGKEMTKAANKEETGTTYSFREDFHFGAKPFAGIKGQREFAKKCVDYVASQVSGALDPSLEVEAYGARLTDPRGLRDGFLGVAVEAPVFVSWATEE